MWAWGAINTFDFVTPSTSRNTGSPHGLEFAAEVIPQAEPAIAIDAIDEFLSNIEKSGTTRRNWRCSMVAVRGSRFE